ncbi:WD40 repeat-like protein [Neocallimastix californiae]|jgi:WD40 repeat protein|uniref:WD40 repeat-like protein n=1 Tax=Neocallimastix californiae TaxID=1754190 RepID=A0A1Y2A178_9FUNG|nr:WD40 repeat-like protein [Neocallimastix californiae]|eukprot:ORY15785.1 WD40 repeat-like protein [Neocallimastix californiae]
MQISPSIQNLVKKDVVTFFHGINGNNYQLNDEIQFDIQPHQYYLPSFSLITVNSSSNDLIINKVEDVYKIKEGFKKPKENRRTKITKSRPYDADKVEIKNTSESLNNSQQNESNQSETKFIEIPCSEAKPKNAKVKPQKVVEKKNFVLKIVANENLARILTSKINKPNSEYLFFSIGLSFFLVDYNSKPKTTLSCICFNEAFPVCHDVNLITKDISSVDVVIGFNTGDIILYNPISGKYIRYNRNGCLNASSCTSIKWIPGSENEFIAAFNNGIVMVFDKDKEDSMPFTPPAVPNNYNNYFSYKFLSSSNPNQWWKVSEKKITALSFSPDFDHIAITSLDGTLKIINYSSNQLCDIYHSYFGGLLCVDWSPDGKFIVTGGQDDLVSIWAFRGNIVARCQGHSSWINSIMFDKYNSIGRCYRFGSVGEDAKILLWEFSVNTIRRPRSKSFRKSKLEVDKTIVSVDHKVLPRSEVSNVIPLVSKNIYDSAICELDIRENMIITCCNSGIIKVWDQE